MRQLPIGISDFKELIDDNYYYVDKTLLVEEVIKSGKVVLITRPRRFGKTLNISMLRYFFEKSEQKNDYLFSSTKILTKPEKTYQNTYPVIFLTFKNITETSFDAMYSTFAYTIGKEFSRHNYLLLGSDLDVHEKERFTRIMHAKGTETDLAVSLEFLSQMLHKHHKQKVIVLIDEYDVPVHTAYLHNFYDRVIDFLKRLLTAVLKDNEHLQKGVLSGILTLAKAGIFSGLNNIEVYDITRTPVSDKFGFTHEEVTELLHYYSLQDKAEGLAAWYDGYTFGETDKIYNPWSVLSCIKYDGSFEQYWANTSDNALVHRLIARATKSTKSELELIITNQSITKTISQSITFGDLDNDPDLIWSLLLFTGYLTYRSCEVKGGKKECALVLPNEEIKHIYFELIKAIFTKSVVGGQAQELLQSLIEGNNEYFSRLLQGFIVTSMSSFDIPQSEPEKSYHLFVLGLLVMLYDQYEIKSNRESGLGRYDILLIPKKTGTPSTRGIIIEFKKAILGETLESAAQKALDQIIDKKYIAELQGRGIQSALAYGIAFEGKNVFVLSKVLS